MTPEPAGDIPPKAWDIGGLFVVMNAQADALETAPLNEHCAISEEKSWGKQCQRKPEIVKHLGVNGVEAKVKHEAVEVMCQHCAGKGEMATACRGCKGKGTVLDEKRTKLLGAPVMKVCGRCNGNRFSRLPITLARARIERIIPDLTSYQWYSGFGDVIALLVTKCWQEEAFAEVQLRKVTR